MENNPGDKPLEETLRSTAQNLNEITKQAARQIEDSLQKSRAKLAEMQQDLRDRGRYAARGTDFYVHDHPWQSIGIAAGIGVVLGFLLRRK